eukprot:TRINITY_DN1168_c0_g1_i3.p7 TRINITY_DN1168_c0_g1~~TRINITY_DN1168_c0_g1_i3.p7  ORF type:complete len:113 (-),score=13.56 TRINITY_DN1168_c0_g1_i3:210-548(-)
MVGTAYGIALCCESIGTTFGALVVGWIADNNRIGDVTDYYWVSIFLAGGAGIAFVTSVALLWIDKKDGNVLMTAGAKQEEKEDDELVIQYMQVLNLRKQQLRNLAYFNSIKN